ncbi:MAG: ankyrin repeat domain-containing protein [Legionellaceae bacterium]|nr:ankyrin repeat domain-containing protein [Legionellaceae bacterium]
MTYNELLTQLNLHTDASATEKLQRLASWCHTHISRDIQFTGHPSEAYEQYQYLAAFFLDDVLPAISKNIGEKHEALDGLTVIQFAASAGFDQWIRALAPDSTMVNTPNASLMTPLHIAALEGYYHTANVLCDLGANLKAENKNAQLPIFSALTLPVAHDEGLKERKVSIFNDLKTNAPETLEHQDNSGNTVLHLIATYGYASVIDDVLHCAPGLFTRQNNHNRYPIHSAILDHQIACVRKFLSLPALEQLTDASGETALHYAARYGSKEMITLCSRAFKNIDLPDDIGKTPLMAAAESGNIDAMDVLISAGANAMLTDHEGNTLLHYAVHYHLTEPTDWILNHMTAIEVNAQNHPGQTALNICEARRDEDKCTLLRKHGATNGIAWSG